MSKKEDFDFYCDVALQSTTDIKIEYESDTVLAFHHTKPNWPVHIVIIPKKHLWDIREVENVELFSELLTVARDILRVYSQEFLDKNGARIITNIGKFQDTPHLHFHVVCGEAIVKDL
jgi:histidine triad (HIT) family protein